MKHRWTVYKTAFAKNPDAGIKSRKTCSPVAGSGMKSLHSATTLLSS